jgi:HK97 family phage portal protein
MGLLARTFSLRALSDPAKPITGAAVLEAIGGGPSRAGISVTQESASRLTAFWCGATILGETLGSVPLHLRQRQGRNSRKATEHPLYPLLHDAPNPEMSSFFVRECMQVQLIYHGNGYAVIRRNGAGAVRELWPLISQRIEPRRAATGALVYDIIMNDGSLETWSAEDVLHIPGKSFDGVKGKSVIRAAADALGTGLAVQEYGATFFKHGARAPGVVKTQLPKLDPETKKNLQETWLSGRTDNWHQVAFLPKNMEYQQVGINPDEAQWLESKKFTVTEIARILNIPPHLLKDLERATFANIEHQGIEFVTYTMRPIYVRWEQELDRKLLTADERASGYYFAFNMEGLLRGDSAARSAFYAGGRQWGILSANDCRELEDLPTLGDKGDIYLTPINMVNAEDLLAGGGAPKPPAGTPPAPPAPAPAPAPAPQGGAARGAPAKDTRGLRLRQRIRKSQVPILEDRASQIVNREIGAVEKMLKASRSARERRALASLRRDINGFYDEHSTWAGQKMRPTLHAYGDLVAGAMADELSADAGDSMPPELAKFTDEYAKRFGVREASGGRLQLLALLDEFEAEGDDAALEAVQQRLNEWGDKRAGKIGLNESVQYMSAAAKTLYVAAGITVLRWVANAGACDFCQSMDGRVAGVEENFVNAGSGVDGGDGQAPMHPSDNIGHPPLHSSCQCDVMAD